MNDVQRRIDVLTGQISPEEARARIIDEDFGGNEEMYKAAVEALYNQAYDQLHASKERTPGHDDPKQRWQTFEYRAVNCGSRADWSERGEPIRILHTTPTDWLVGYVFTPTGIISTSVHLEDYGPVKDIVAIGTGEQAHPAQKAVELRLYDPNQARLESPVGMAQLEVDALYY